MYFVIVARFAQTYFKVPTKTFVSQWILFGKTSASGDYPKEVRLII